MAKIDLPKRSGKQSKVSEKSGNFENDIEWQPWLLCRPVQVISVSLVPEICLVFMLIMEN